MAVDCAKWLKLEHHFGMTVCSTFGYWNQSNFCPEANSIARRIILEFHLDNQWNFPKLLINYYTGQWVYTKLHVIWFVSINYFVRIGSQYISISFKCDQITWPNCNWHQRSNRIMNKTKARKECRKANDTDDIEN